MKNLFRKLFSILLIWSICFVSMGNILVFAIDSETTAANNVVVTHKTPDIVVDMNGIDMTKPYEITREIVNSRGETVILKAVYTPKKTKPGIAPMWSHEYPASVGTWKSYFDGSIIAGMSYEFDVTKSGNHWKISNARNLVAHAALSTIKSKSLTINRPISAPSFPAEIIGICSIDVLETPIGHAFTLDAWIENTITDEGIVTVSGN